MFPSFLLCIITAPRNSASWPGPNNLPPLQFHDVHGDNIRLSRDRTLAKRYETFCKGVAFSARPIKINERICIRFSEVSRNWSGVLRFGFTYNDPATLRNNLPKYACPDLTNKPGFWAKALPEQFCERDYILFYYVTAAGDVYFGVNGEEMGVFITGVETRHPLWTLVDIYGNCSAIEFVDSRACVHQTQSQRRSVPREQEIDRIVPSMQSLAVNEHPAVPVIQQQHQQQPQTARSAAVYGNTYTPVTFHRVKGRNVVLSADKLVATRADSEYCQGYVFTARPICIGEKIIVQILRTDSMYMGALALGLTSCNAATLQPQDLPDDSDLLLDRPEYWVVSKDVASNLNRGDEIIFCVTPSGEVQISKNNGPPSVVMHVDQSLQLWAFLDVYGSTQSVRVFSHMVAPSQYNNPLNVPNTNSIVPQRQLSQQSVRMPMPSTESLSSASSQSLYRGENQQTRMPTPLSHIKPTVQAITTAATTATLPSSSSTGCVINNDMIQLQPGGTVLVVNLPPATNNDINNKQVVPRITQLPLNAAQTSNASPMVSFQLKFLF